MKFSRRLPSIVLAALAAAASCAPSQAAVFSFSGDSGNTGNGSPPPFAFGTLPPGSSSFDVTVDAFIPFPGGSNHGGSNLFTFSLASQADVTFTVAPGLHTEIMLAQLNYSRFSNPNYNNCCFIVASNGDNNNPYPTQPVSLGALLAPGDYEMGLLFVIPAAPIGTAPYTFETYSGSVQVSTGVPEPSTWALFLAGFAGLGFADRHRRLNAA
jgi:hypothetical protein